MFEGRMKGNVLLEMQYILYDGEVRGFIEDVGVGFLKKTKTC